MSEPEIYFSAGSRLSSESTSPVPSTSPRIQKVTDQYFARFRTVSFKSQVAVGEPTIGSRISAYSQKFRMDARTSLLAKKPGLWTSPGLLEKKWEHTYFALNLGVK